MRIEKTNYGKGIFVGNPDRFWFSVNDDFSLFSIRFWNIFFLSIGDKV